GLFHLAPEGAPVAAMVDATRQLLGLMSATERQASCFPVDSETWRRWQNTERFLGDLVGAPHILGEWSYNFCLFGEPSLREPWGWQLFGHHLSLNCFVLEGQMVLSPGFWGAE